MPCRVIWMYCHLYPVFFTHRPDRLQEVDKVIEKLSAVYILISFEERLHSLQSLGFPARHDKAVAVLCCLIKECLWVDGINNLLVIRKDS